MVRDRLALCLPQNMPPVSVQDRWFAEPLRLLSLPASTFMNNRGGYPVLSKAHQALIFRYLRLRFPPWILLEGVGSIQGLDDGSSSHPSVDALNSNPTAEGVLSSDASESPTPAEAEAFDTTGMKHRSRDLTPHLSYIRHLQRSQPPRAVIERFGSGYQEYLQAPLQPLTDNLESLTYEVFEKDPVKYEWYERAITAALRGWVKRDRPGSGFESRIVVAVVGAGRGPLVTRALRASAAAEVEIELWAVEKNPNAYVVLQHHNKDHWKGNVHVVLSDMRSWKGPNIPGSNEVPIHTTDGETDMPPPRSHSDHHVHAGGHGKVDIIISELLGSFADNELSPECLDGVQHVLNPTDGVSIPSSYSAHLTPIAAPRLHTDIKCRLENDSNAAETPYVVMLHAFSNLSTVMNSSAPDPIILKAWEFWHPNSIPGTTGSNRHNQRYTRLRFPCPTRGACDGLAGYFEATLWGDVELSTRPDEIDRKSPDMTSWFPLFFPLVVSFCNVVTVDGCLGVFTLTIFIDSIIFS